MNGIGVGSCSGAACRTEGLPLKRKFRPRCCAKTRAGVPCIMRVVPGKRRCRFHGGMNNEAWSRPDRRSTATALVFGHANIGLCHDFGVRPHDARTRVQLAISDSMKKSGPMLPTLITRWAVRRISVGGSTIGCRLLVCERAAGPPYRPTRTVDFEELDQTRVLSKRTQTSAPSVAPPHE